MQPRLSLPFWPCRGCFLLLWSFVSEQMSGRMRRSAWRSCRQTSSGMFSSKSAASTSPSAGERPCKDALPCRSPTVRRLSGECSVISHAGDFSSQAAERAPLKGLGRSLECRDSACAACLCRLEARCGTVHCATSPSACPYSWRSPSL